MTERVTIEDGLVVPVSQRIKNICKKRRDELRVTNQQIADGILDMFGVDVPLGTVANFFSERAKASSVYTTGYICAYLGVSLDEQFGIKTDLPVESATEIAVLQERIVSKDTELRYKDERIEELKTTVIGFRPILYTFIITIVLLAAIVLWFVSMDLSMPHGGLFQQGTGHPYVGIITMCVAFVAVVVSVVLFVSAKRKKRKALKK